MEIIKKSVSLILWTLMITLGGIILSNTASKMGAYSTEAWIYVKGQFAHSALFWAMGIMILIQVILMNLKPFKCRTVLVTALAIIAVIVSAAFYQDLSRTMTAYKQIILDTDGIPEIGMLVYAYRKNVLIYSVVSSALAVINPIILLIDRPKQHI